MRASYRMARRVELVPQLHATDEKLQRLLGQAPSNRIHDRIEKLFAFRDGIADELVKVGYQPPAPPTDLDEAKVV